MNDRLIAALLGERDRRIEAENELGRLRYQVDVLNAKLIELSNFGKDAPELRRAYRRGYHTGYTTGRARADRNDAPEMVARGDLGRAMRADLVGTASEVPS